MKKLIWIRADKGKTQAARKKIVTTAIENNFTNIIVLDEDKNVFKKLGKFNMIFIDQDKIKVNGKKGKYIALHHKKDEEKVAALAGKTDFVVVAAKNWKVIPLENLIAAYQKAPTTLLAEVSNVKDAKLYLETLEVGVDGVVLNITNLKTLHGLRKILDEFDVTNLKLVSAKITKIEPIGIGDRVCIDSCSILKVGEGMLIGSQANGLFLVHSESIKSEYADTRPFRVNAGPVHSYILGPQDQTRYLSDLKVGDKILVVDHTGKTRSVVIGRIKMEKRPLILVEVAYRNNKFNIILQNAETIRLISDNKPVSIVNLRTGDSILIWLGGKGRHFGMKVAESIIEK